MTSRCSGNSSIQDSSSVVISNEHPLAAPLDELVQHHGHVREHEAADVEAEELCGVAGRELEADVRGGRVLEAWVFDLAGDLICFIVLEWSCVRRK
jgi:hypothetical protein